MSTVRAADRGRRVADAPFTSNSVLVFLGAVLDSEATLRRKTAILTRMLNLQGSIGMFGHVSVRVPGTNRVLLSPGGGTDKSKVKAEDIACAIFTLTPDLNADFPAYAARQMGWRDVPLMCARELDVPAAMEKVIRVLLLVNSEIPASKIKHQYLGDTPQLRPDLAQKGPKGAK